MELALGLSEAEANSWGWRGTDQGSQMKTDYGWNYVAGYPGGNGTNSSGFSGLPGGIRFNTNFSNQSGNNGYWWSSSLYDGSQAWIRELSFYYESVGRKFSTLQTGCSVRCVRDAE